MEHSTGPVVMGEQWIACVISRKPKQSGFHKQAWRERRRQSGQQPAETRGPPRSRIPMSCIVISRAGHTSTDRVRANSYQATQLPALATNAREFATQLPESLTLASSVCFDVRAMA